MDRTTMRSAETLSTTDRKTILEMRNITKKFPGVVANDHIYFDLTVGEVHGILGENGAGKTTLMNILFGLYRMDEGEILVNGRRVIIKSPKDAIDLGIGMVHQFHTLAPRLSVMENIILGQEPEKGLFLDRIRAEKEIQALENKFNLKVDLKARSEQLPTGEKQRVEILKALYHGAQILIMDEPTSMLTPQEKDELLKTLRKMVEENVVSIIFITHKLPEVIAVCDRVTILRKGRVVDVLKTEMINEKSLAHKMIGTTVSLNIRKSAEEIGETILKVQNISTRGDTGTMALQGISFSMKRGEILGVAGVSGSGQRELMEVLTGTRPTSTGKVFIKGEDVTNAPPWRVRDLGVGYIPEDRMEESILSNLSVKENVILGIHSKPPCARKWFLPFEKKWFMDHDAIESYALRLVAEYNVITPSINRPAGNLSGGNIQRLILARELARKPDILFANKPTSGLDVGSRRFVHQQLIKERKRGMAMLLISEDLDELIEMSNRIAVVYEGKIVVILPANTATKEQIGIMMTGGKHPHQNASQLSL